MSDNKLKKPVWWKNTFYHVAIALALLGLFGLIRGEDTIRDPGQVFEKGLIWIYFGGAAVMALNGWLTHKQTEQAFEEAETKVSDSEKH